MDFGDDDDIDDETFALVDKIVEEHNAKKALTQLQSQAASPIIERQVTQNGAHTHQMRPTALFPAPEAPRALPAAQQQVQVQRPPLPPGGGPPVGRITHAAAQLRADAAPTHISPPPAGAAGSSGYPPLAVQGSLHVQQRLSELEGTNKLLRTNLDNVEREKFALKQRLQQLEAKSGGSGGPHQAASMAEMQRQLEQLQQQLLFKDQELEETKRRAASRPQETAGTSVGAGGGAAAAMPPQQQKPQQRQQESERIKRRANGTEVPVSTTVTAAVQQGIVTSAIAPPTPLFSASTLAEMTAAGGGEEAVVLTDRPGALIARLWASCPDSMSTLLTLDTSFLATGPTAASNLPFATRVAAFRHNNNNTNYGVVTSSGRGDAELSRLQLVLKSDFSLAAAGMVQPFTLLGSLTAYVSRVCYLINAQSSGQSSGEEGDEQKQQQLNVASAALTIMRHLILNDAACRHAALMLCCCTISPSHIDGTTGQDQARKNLVTNHSSRITFEKDTTLGSDAAAIGGGGGGSRSYGGGGIEAGIQPLISQLSRLITTTAININNLTNIEYGNDDRSTAATGLQAVCITAALLSHSKLLLGVADLAHALVSCAAPSVSSNSNGKSGGGSGNGRAAFLPLLRSGAVVALLRGVPPQQRCRGIQLLHALLEDPQICAEFASVCATPSGGNAGGDGGGGGAADGAGDTPKTRAAAAREAQLTKPNKKATTKDNSNKNKKDNAGAGAGGGGGSGGAEVVHSWASELMIALLSCLVLIPPKPGHEDLETSPLSEGGLDSYAAYDDDTKVARSALAVMALLLEKRCTACFMHICHLDDTALRRRNSFNSGGNGASAGAGLGSGGAGGSGSGNNEKNNNNNNNDKKQSPSVSEMASSTFTVSFPVRLIVLAEEAVKYIGDDEDVTLLRTALWPEGRSPAVRAAQSTWQHRLRLAQESLTLLRGVILAEGKLANVALEELLLTPQLAQRMLTATGRMARITATAPPCPSSFSEAESTTPGSPHSVEMLFPALPIASWAYAIGSSSTAASLAPVATAERRAGLPCSSANDVSHLARGIRIRILYKLRS